ncbi:DUF4267 domain-containing protein [Streptomyces exfoliatus]|uniref:DUF4267 domain-containing protein n=1 Tax=Streptomyces exfoliatus TaxID=1905 RepID=UPI0007C473ED|nr:DUF4267 domain-containing protein [Streptomyces exfoliatus]
MNLHRATTVLSVLLGLACLWFGISFLLTPATAAAGFGIPSWPEGDAAGYFTVKAVRDLADGAIVLTLLALGRRRTLAWVMLLFVIVPFGDAIAVLGHGGGYTAALGIHAATGVVVLLAAGLLFATSSRGDALPRPSRSGPARTGREARV